MIASLVSRQHALEGRADSARVERHRVIEVSCEAVVWARRLEGNSERFPNYWYVKGSQSSVVEVEVTAKEKSELNSPFVSVATQFLSPLSWYRHDLGKLVHWAPSGFRLSHLIMDQPTPS